MVVCYIGLGSNLGDRKKALDDALKRLKGLSGTKVRRVSAFIETKPQGGPPQGPYLNAVAEVETGLLPYQLLQELQRIETALGRIRTVVNGPRTIDLDILMYGDTLMQEQALSIPHPRILEREFVLAPLKEIAPHAVTAVKKIITKKRITKKRK